MKHHETTSQKLGAPGFSTLSATSTSTASSANRPGFWNKSCKSFRNLEPRWSKKITSKGPHSCGRTSSQTEQRPTTCQSISHVQSKPNHVQTQVSTSEKQIAHNLSNLPILNPSPAESPRCGPRGQSPPAATPRAAPPAGPGALPWDPSRRYAPGHAGEPRRRSEGPRSPRSNPPGSWLGKKKEHKGVAIIWFVFSWFGLIWSDILKMSNYKLHLHLFANLFRNVTSRSG